MMLTDTILRNRYKILKELGRGGFSVTYLAVDLDLPGNPKCVVKQLKTRNSDNTILQIAKKLFNREAQVLYRLGKGHKQIPEMFAHFEENDEFYLVQEFVDGHDLTKEVKPRHRLSEEKVTQLLEEILEVLVFVHENNVIHRDIKLRNIMRRREDGKIVLIDFGAVKEIKGLTKNQQGDVNSTLIIGTPGYMPDEQANGKPRLCSDVYAVGMLGIQAVTGISPRELPFDPDTGELIWLNSAKVSDKLAEVLTGMVRHHFSARYQTAAEALKALKSPVSLAPSAYKAYEAPPVTLPSKYSKSRPQFLQSLGLIGLMGIGFGLAIFGWNFVQSSSNGNEPALSEVQDTIIKNINPSTTPKATNNSNNSNNNSNPSIFLPFTPKVSSQRKPVFSPFFIPLFNENKIQVTPENPQSKTNQKNQALPTVDSINKPIRKPIRRIIQPVPKTSIVQEENTNSIPELPTPQPPKNLESLPSISPSPSKKVDHPSTSLPSQTDLEDKQDSNSPTSLPSQTDLEDKSKQKATSSSQQNQTPPSPSTPAIENESPSPSPSPTASPIPTPSPIPTTGSVIVPTTKPQETPPEEESNNYFITVPTQVTPIPEAEIQPQFSPQPTPTASPQPFILPEAEITPTPQASVVASPESSEIEPTPQTSPTPPTDSSEIEPTPQTSPTPPPESSGIKPTPQTSVAASPESKIEAKPSPKPIEKPGLSLEGFAI
jgi:serine/threonine protein kinase